MPIVLSTIILAAIVIYLALRWEISRRRRRMLTVAVLIIAVAGVALYLHLKKGNSNG